MGCGYRPCWSRFRCTHSRVRFRPAPPSPTPRQSEAAKDFFETLEGKAAQFAAFRALFTPSASERGVNRDEVEKGVREYIERHRPHLDLSPSDYRSLTDLVILYRQTYLDVRSDWGTRVDTERLRAQSSEMKGVMEEFKP